MSGALPVVVVSSLEEAEQLTANRNAGQVLLELRPEVSLTNADKIHERIRPGSHGFELINKELADCKRKAKVKLDAAYLGMYESWMGRVDQELLDLEVQINLTKQKLATPMDQIPDKGPPAEQRNQGVVHVVFLHEQANPFPEYDTGLPRIQQPYTDLVERGFAIERDRRSQRAWWELNLTFLEAQKEILTDKKVKMERKLKSVMDNALRSNSLVGAGYADYTFLY